MRNLEDSLRSDPRTQSRLNHMRDASAASAAVKFFVYGQPSSNIRWYGSETWQQIMEVFSEKAAVPNGVWHESTNNDPGSLRTGSEELRIGQVIEIEGEGKRRYITSTMGSPGRFHAHFKNQKVVPVRELRWRLVASATPVDASASATAAVAPQHLATAFPFERTVGLTRLERARRHPVVGLLIFLGAVVAGLGSFTDGLGKLIEFLRKYLGA
jgi:uncharacterized protein YndB with AHSA1/START domain